MVINCISALFLSLFALFYIWIAKKYNIVDRPNFRSSHDEPIIRGAGILFFLALIIFFLTNEFKYPFLICGISVIAVVSYIDDLVTLSSKFRLVFQFLSVSLMLYQLSILLPIDIWYLPILIIAGVGFLNIFNFMDGINGITGLYALVAFLGLLVLNFKEGVIEQQLFILIIISIVIFGFFNFRRNAKFFCGDVGSITLAAILFFVIVLYCFVLKSPLFILLMALYLADSGLTILYRKFYLKENITVAHRHHIYQKLVDTKKLSHLKTAASYAILQAIITALVLFCYKLDFSIQIFIFLLIGLGLITLYLLVFKNIAKLQ